MLQRSLFTGLFVLAGVAIPAVLPAYAQPIRLGVDSPSSSVGVIVDVASPFTGSLIGNFDELNNPTGTRTLPGAFGGTGNQPIPVTGRVAVRDQTTTRPGGEFTLIVDTAAGTAQLSALQLDLLSGARPDIVATFTLRYATFRTVNPNSLYIGGIDLPIPLGSLVLTELRVAQTGDGSIGTLTPTKTPGEFDFQVAAIGTLTWAATLQGQPVTPPGPGIVPVALTGRIQLGTGGTPAVVNATAQTDFEQIVPAPPGGGFEGLPLAVPTILPPGATANLLLSGLFGDLTVRFESQSTLVAAGTPCPADVNGDGTVDVNDFFSYLTFFAGNDPRSDIDGVPGVDINDFFRYLELYAGGCVW